MAQVHSTVMPAMRYRNAPAIIDWLGKVFGFERHAVYEGAGGEINHAELKLNGGMIMLGSTKDDEHGSRFQSPDALEGAETRSVYIVVEDADAVYKRARRRRNGGSPHRRYAVWQPRVHHQRSGRPLVERGNVRPLGGAWMRRSIVARLRRDGL